MQNFVKIKKGTYRNAPIKDAIFPVVKPLTFGKKGAFVTVDGSSLMGPNAKRVRILVDSPLSVEPASKEAYQEVMPVKKTAKKKETKQQASTQCIPRSPFGENERS